MLPKAVVVSVLLPVPLSGSAATSGHLSSRMGVIYAVCVNHALPSRLPVQDALAANIANPDKLRILLAGSFKDHRVGSGWPVQPFHSLLPILACFDRVPRALSPYKAAGRAASRSGCSKASAN